MEMQQMMELLLKEMRADQPKMDADKKDKEDFMA
jgi:hypothetical protein